MACEAQDSLDAFGKVWECFALARTRLKGVPWECCTSAHAGRVDSQTFH